MTLASRRTKRGGTAGLMRADGADRLPLNVRIGRRSLSKRCRDPVSRTPQESDNARGALDSALQRHRGRRSLHSLRRRRPRGGRPSRSATSGWCHTLGFARSRRSGRRARLTVSIRGQSLSPSRWSWASTQPWPNPTSAHSRRTGQPRPTDRSRRYSSPRTRVRPGGPGSAAGPPAPACWVRWRPRRRRAAPALALTAEHVAVQQAPHGAGRGAKLGGYLREGPRLVTSRSTR